MHMQRRPFLALAACLLVGTIAACDRSVSEPELSTRVAAVILRTSSGDVIFSHNDHWHGAPLVPLGGSERIDVFFSSVQMSADDHDAPPTESWFTLADEPGMALSAVIEHPTIASWSGRSGGGTLAGLTAGPSRISFIVKRGTTTLLEAPPLNFRVQ
jgi:hypothetical protein